VSVYWESGRAYAKVMVGPRRRRTVALLGAADEKDAAARDVLLRSLVKALRASEQDAFVDATIANVANWPSERLPELKRYVLGVLCKGQRVAAAPAPQAPGLQATAAPKSAGVTFKEFAETWTSGKLAREHPDYLREKSSASDDRQRLEKHVYPHLGDTPLALVTLADCKRVLARLPASLSGASRRQVAQLMMRTFRLAVWPCELLAHSPLPRGFLPRAPRPKAGTFLYPAEDAKLLACIDVPLERRILYGMMAREGLRRSEAAALKVRDIDREHGVVRIDRPKEGRPKLWDLDPGTARALERWLEDHHPKPRPTSRMFVGADGEPLNVEHLASQLREDLRAAGVDRAELFDASAHRMHLRAHDLRATFATLSLAAGKTETWVRDRTGHADSKMLDRYRRSARLVEELHLGQLAPLDQAIPELGAKVSREVSRADGAR
jgi:integrase